MAVMLCGCAVHKPIHPGALNAFDSQAYDTLITTQAALNQARTQIDQTPGYAKFRPEFNKTVEVFNVALAAYKTYHGGGGSKAAVETQLAGLGAQLGALLADLGVKL